MKIIGISSSLNFNGSSARLLREALKGAQEAGAEVEEIYLPNCHLEFCQGCLGCVSGDKCVMNDDLNTLRDKLLTADGLILSSPTHGMSPSAMMKNFSDRIGIYSVYRSALGDKYVAGIATAGGVGAGKTAKMLTGITAGFHKSGIVSGILGVNVGWKTIEEFYPQARTLGRKIATDIQSHKKYPWQKIFSRLLNNLIVKPVMKKNIRDHRDKEMKGVYLYLKTRNLI